MFGSTYDIRTLLQAASDLRDGAPLDIPGGPLGRQVLNGLVGGTQIATLLAEHGLVRG